MVAVNKSLTLRSHRTFEAYVPDFTSGATRVLAYKLESITVGTVAHRYLDIVLGDKNRIDVLAFARVIDGRIVWHSRHLEFGTDALASIAGVLEPRFAATDPTSTTIELLSDDDELAVFVRDETDRAPVVPGLSAYGRVFDAAERYADIAASISGCRVLDIHAGSGYAAAMVAHHAAAFDLASSGIVAIARRFRVHPPIIEAPENGRYDVVLALDIEPGEIASACACPARRPGGRTVVSVRGAAGREALVLAGASVRQLSRAGCDALGPFNEWLGVFGAKTPRAEIVEERHDPARVTPSKLRVLFALRASAKHIFGGDVVQVRETARELAQRGHDVHVVMETKFDPSGFDIVHLTNLTVPPDTLEQARCVERFGGAVVLMPIFTDHSDETVWGMRTTQAMFAAANDSRELEERLGQLAQRQLAVNGLQPPPARTDMFAQYSHMQMEIVARSDFAVANAHSEMHRLYRYLACDIPYAVAPSCADPNVYGAHARDEFVTRYGLSDFVLMTGRFEPRKNHLLFFEAMRSLTYPALCIGGSHEIEFARLVRAYRLPNIAMLPHIPERDLAGAYAAARVVALPSWDEVVSLTSLNAAVSETSLVLTRNSYEHEYFRDDAEYCDPGSVVSMKAAIRRAWETHEARNGRRAALALRVREQYTWARAAELTEIAYYRVLESNPRGTERRARYAS